VTKVRADAERNVELLLTTGAQLLTKDPSASIAAIAAAAGLDRRTVYRRFASRDDLLAAIYRARYDAVEDVIAAAELQDAPVALALRRFVEGAIAVHRKWPVELSRINDRSIDARRARYLAQIQTFADRATRERLLRPGFPPGWVPKVLQQLMVEAAEGLPDLSPAQAADLVVDTLLLGTGRS
jgi:AcrR family transcriptional regulator